MPRTSAPQAASCQMGDYWRIDAFPRFEEAPLYDWCTSHDHCFDSSVKDAPWCYYSWDALRAFALQGLVTILAVVFAFLTFSVWRRGRVGGDGQQCNVPCEPSPGRAPRHMRELGGWPARPDGRGVLPEYRSALMLTCLAPAVLHASPLRQHLAALASWQRDFSLSRAPACALPTGRRLVEAVASRAGAGPGVTDAAFAFYGQVTPFESDCLTMALQCALSNGTRDLCSTALLAMQDGVGFCRSRARLVVQGVICSCVSALRASKAAAQAAEDAHVTRDGEAVTLRARTRLYALCFDTCQDIKDAAFRQAFIEPALWYSTMVQNTVLHGDADVHGGGVHSALLEATVGICTTRMAELVDGVIGVVDFRAAAARESGGAFASGLRALVSGDHLGRPWTRVQECASVSSRSAEVCAAQTPDAFIFTSRREECSVRELADRAASSSLSTQAQRVRYAAYLETFTQLLSADVVLPRLIAAVLGSSMRGAALGDDGLRLDLQLVYDELRLQNGADALPNVSSPPDDELSRGVSYEETDVRHWLYDSISGALNVPRAKLIFGRIGVVAERCSLGEPLGFPLPPPAPEPTPKQVTRLAGGWGGSGGIFFDDAAELGGAANIRRLVRIVVRAGCAIDAVQATYELRDGEIVTLDRRGGQGGSAFAVVLAPGEYIARATGRAGPVIECLSFLIAKEDGSVSRVVGPFGNPAGVGAPFSVEGPIVALVGRCGLLLDALSLYVLRREH